MISDRETSNAALRRDIQRWEADLAMWMKAGRSDSKPANDLRSFIAEARYLIGD
jgi:hypothetical protein